MGTPDAYRQHETARPQFQVMIPPPTNQVHYNLVMAGADMLYPQPTQYEGAPPVYQNQTVSIYQGPIRMESPNPERASY